MKSRKYRDMYRKLETSRRWEPLGPTESTNLQTCSLHPIPASNVLVAVGACVDNVLATLHAEWNQTAAKVTPKQTENYTNNPRKGPTLKVCSCYDVCSAVRTTGADWNRTKRLHQRDWRLCNDYCCVVLPTLLLCITVGWRITSLRRWVATLLWLVVSRRCSIAPMLSRVAWLSRVARLCWLVTTLFVVLLWLVRGTISISLVAFIVFIAWVRRWWASRQIGRAHV